MKFLLVIDMQNDFITGALGTPEAQAIVGNAAELIRGFDGSIIYTRDTHGEDYERTQEGRKLPVPHCLKDSDGWQICREIENLIKPSDLVLDKVTFGAIDLPDAMRKIAAEQGQRADVQEPEEIHLAGLCTDICVISNALLIKAFCPELPVRGDAACCAGVTPQSHENALKAMEMCQIDVIRKEIEDNE